VKIVLLILLLLISCNNKPTNHIKSYKIPKSVSKQIQPKENYLPFTWETPDNWNASTKSSMRVASYLLPSSKGNADLSVIYLNGDGGGTLANVNRWRSQLDLPNLAKKEIELVAQSFNGNIGPYKIYEIININNKESGFLCSIIPADDFTVFIKLNAHINSIDELRKQFIDFSSSFRYNE